MNEKNNLTTGSAGKTLIRFALPFLLASFLQTFYGMADLYVIGKFNGSESTTAVSIGSQIMHMITVMTVGFTTGITVRVGRAIGEKNKNEISRAIGSSSLVYMLFSFLSAIVLFLASAVLVRVMQTPAESVPETDIYLKICLLGIPFITLYNIVSGIYRGLGNSKLPMIFVGIACVVNVILDFLLVGFFKMGAAGAAFATVSGQAVSSITALIHIRKHDMGIKINKSDFCFNMKQLMPSLKIGFPIAMQDGFIQIAFIIITVIANMRGLTAATAVGIVEKIIGFMFLVPSALLSAVSAMTAQNLGAGNRKRARLILRYGIIITSVYGLICGIYNQFLPETLVGLFTKDDAVLLDGCEYLMSYSFDVLFAGIHFCFSGYFCGDQKSVISFIHNIASIILMRIPGAYLASKLFPETLWPMGLAAPLGSLLSVIICSVFYFFFLKKEKSEK